MHVDAIQQLEVALWGSLAAEVVGFLSSGLSKSKPVTVVTAQLHPNTYTATPPAPPPALIHVAGVSDSSPVPVMAKIESKPDEEILTTSKPKISDIPAPVSKCHHVSTTLVSPSVSAKPSTSSTASFPNVVVPELVIPAEAYPEHVNRQGGGKDYLCQLCHFSHSNLDSILTPVRNHLDITIGCPVCGRGYQNAVSLLKHGSDIHDIQIVASSTSLQGVVDPKEEI